MFIYLSDKEIYLLKKTFAINITMIVNDLAYNISYYISMKTYFSLFVTY